MSGSAVTGAAVRVALRQAVQGHGETVVELTLRPMTGKDIAAVGFVTKFGADGETIVDAPKVSAMAARLAGVPLSTIGQLSAPDWVDVMEAVTGFLAPTPSPRTKPEPTPETETKPAETTTETPPASSAG